MNSHPNEHEQTLQNILEHDLHLPAGKATRQTCQYFAFSYNFNLISVSLGHMISITISIIVTIPDF